MTDDEKRDVFENLMWDTVGELFEKHQGDLAKFNQNQQEIVALWRLEVDTYNGGIEQFICNWGYETIQLAKKSLSNIKAVHALKLLEQAEVIFNSTPKDNNITEIQDIGQLLTDEQYDELNTISESYWDNEDDVILLGYQYYCQ